MKTRLRYLLSSSFFLGYGLLALPFAPVILAMPVTWVRAVIRTFYKGFRVLAGVCGLYRVELDKATEAVLRSAKGKVVVMNHISLIDICIILSYLPDATAIAKAGTLKNPALGAVVKKMFIVNSEDPKRILAECGELLKKGVNIVIFPQGTRNGEKFQRGAARLALALQAEILPVSISYDPVVLDKRHPWYYAGDRLIRIRLKAHDAIQAEGAADFHHAKALTQRLADILTV